MLAFFSNTAARVRRNEKGATAVEYGIMVALIAVVIIVAVTTLGGSLSASFEKVACEVGGKNYTAAVAAAPATATTGAVTAAAATCLP